jgi:mono/diheme cytochrome c family protein
VPGATLRVYVNIGSYSQHWLQQHNALIGLTKQKPFSVKTAQENSVYWLATQQKFENIAKFFTRLKSFRLEDAPGGKEYITKDEAVMKRGKIVFGENCAQCHSSKRPPAGANEMDWFRQEALKPDFRDNNFYSDDKRYPVTIIQTNAARASGTNAKRGHIWDSF